jgi:hypothetical protein
MINSGTGVDGNKTRVKTYSGMHIAAAIAPPKKAMTKQIKTVILAFRSGFVSSDSVHNPFNGF